MRAIGVIHKVGTIHTYLCRHIPIGIPALVVAYLYIMYLCSYYMNESMQDPYVTNCL